MHRLKTQHYQPPLPTAQKQVNPAALGEHVTRKRSDYASVAVLATSISVDWIPVSDQMNALYNTVALGSSSWDHHNSVCFGYKRNSQTL